MSQAESEYTFPVATQIVQDVFSRMKSNPRDYQFMLDVIENDILEEDTVSNIHKVFKSAKYIDSENNMYTFTGNEMVYFLENYMIPTQMAPEVTTMQAWPMNLVFKEPNNTNNFMVLVYTEHSIIMYEGKPGHHEFVVIPRS